MTTTTGSGPAPDIALAAAERLLRPVDRESRSARLYQRGGKRLTDVLLSATLLVVLAPVIAAVAVLVLWHLGRPVLFRQPRLGRDGEPFMILKFRTMHPDRRTTRQPVLVERRHPIPSQNDPRLVPLGRWLSAASLDELPQLVQVLIGQMSIVGPRPDYVHRLECYSSSERRRFDVRPGLTGPWQTVAGTSSDLHEYAAVDVLYADRCSLANDLRVLAATPGGALRRSRAGHLTPRWAGFPKAPRCY